MSQERILIYSSSEEDLDMEVDTYMSKNSEGSNANLSAMQTEHEENVYEMEYDMPCKFYRGSESEAISLNDPMATTPRSNNGNDTRDESAIKNVGDKRTIDDILTTSDEEAPSDRFLSEEGGTSDYLSREDYLSDSSSDDSFYTAPNSPLPPTELDKLIQACNESTERDTPRTNALVERIKETMNDNNNLANKIKDRLKEIDSEKQKLHVIRLKRAARHLLKVQSSKPKKDPTINVNPFATARRGDLEPNPISCKDSYVEPRTTSSSKPVMEQPRMTSNSKPVMEQQRSTFSFGRPPPLDSRPSPLGSRPLRIEPRPLRIEPRPLRIEPRPLRIEPRPLQIRTTFTSIPARARYMNNPPMNTRTRHESIQLMNIDARYQRSLLRNPRERHEITPLMYARAIYESNPPINTRARYESNLPLDIRARYENNLPMDTRARYENNLPTSACSPYPIFHPLYPKYPKVYPLLIRSNCSNRSTRPICTTLYPPPTPPTYRRGRGYERRRDDVALERRRG